MSEQIDGQRLLDRLARLERDSRRLKTIALGLVLAMSSFVWMGQTGPARTVEAEKFVLRDSAGKTRAVLTIVNNAATLGLSDSRGRLRAYVSEDNVAFLGDDGNVEATFNGRALQIRHKGGAKAIELSAYASQPLLSLSDPLGKNWVSTGTSYPGGPHLELGNDAGFHINVGNGVIVGPPGTDTFYNDEFSISAGRIGEGRIRWSVPPIVSPRTP